MESLPLDAPELCIHRLTSEAAKGRLSICKMESALEESGYADNRAYYAHVAGETMFWRRNPWQVARTLAFIVQRDNGDFFKVKSSELQPLHEAFEWLRVHNQHIQRFLSVAERFGANYMQLLSVLPVGNPRARVTLRLPRHREREERTLGDTLESEEVVLTVLDPAQQPRNWAVHGALADQIGTVVERIDETSRGLHGEDAPRVDTTMATAASDSARTLLDCARVSLSDPDLDAKLFPALHLHGSIGC